MTNNGEHRVLEEAIQAVKHEQNCLEEALREEFLSKHLFHDTHNTQITEVFKDDAPWIREQFLADKQEKNMGELLSLATREPYLNVINVVELGVSTDMPMGGEMDGLKDEYEDLLRWMIEHEWIKDEPSREQSGRSLEVRPSKVTGSYVAIVRNRPLIATDVGVYVDGTRVGVRIGIAKRMVFSMPARLYVAIVDQFDDPNLEKEESIRCIEGHMQKRSKILHPIRTAYYLSTMLV